MSSPYVGLPVYSGTITLMTDADSPSALTFRDPLERVIDNTASLKVDVATERDRARGRLVLAPQLVITGATSEAAIGVASTSQFGGGAIVCKSGASNVYRLFDTAPSVIQGSLASITSLCTDMAFQDLGSTNAVAIGTGGNNNCSTANNGASWSAGGAIGYVPKRIVRDTVNNFYLTNNPAGAAVSRSSNAAAWSSVAPGSITLANGGLAMLAGGVAVVCGGVASVVPAFAVSSNGGSSWANSGGTVANSATYDDTGCIAGNGGSVVVHVGGRSAGTTLRVSTSPDGANWTTRADLAAPAGLTFGSRARVMCCQNTGLLIIVVPIAAAGSLASWVSFDSGVTWFGPVAQGSASAPIDSFGVAGGKLFTSAAATIFASHGGYAI